MNETEDGQEPRAGTRATPRPITHMDETAKGNAIGREPESVTETDPVKGTMMGKDLPNQTLKPTLKDLLLILNQIYLKEI